MKKKERCQWEIKESSRPCGKVAKQRLYGKPYCQRHFDILRTVNPIVKGYNILQQALKKQGFKAQPEMKVDEGFYK